MEVGEGSSRGPGWLNAADLCRSGSATARQCSLPSATRMRDAVEQRGGLASRGRCLFDRVGQQAHGQTFYDRDASSSRHVKHKH